MPIKRLEQHLTRHREILRTMQRDIEREIHFTKHKKGIQKLIHYSEDDDRKLHTNEILNSEISLCH